MQRAVVTEQKMRNLNVRQENAMFNLAALQSVVPLRECKLSALAATVHWLYQRLFASVQPSAYCEPARRSATQSWFQSLYQNSGVRICSS